MLAGTINDLSAKLLFFLVGGVIVCMHKISVRLEVYFCSFFPRSFLGFFYIL